MQKVGVLEMTGFMQDNSVQQIYKIEASSAEAFKVVLMGIKYKMLAY